MKTLCTDADIVGPWVVEKAGGRYQKGNAAIGLLVDGALKVGVYYDGFTGRNGSIAMHSRCDDGKAPNMLFYWAIFDYPFNQLRVRRVNGLVAASNTIARRIDEKLGFKLETPLIDYFPDGDGLLYRMLRTECRWLDKGDRYERYQKAA